MTELLEPVSRAADAENNSRELPNHRDPLNQVPPVPVPSWLSRISAEPRRHSLRCLPAQTRLLKRLIDVVGACLLLIVTSPLIAGAMVAIRLTSRGPAIFRQTRVGINVRRRPQGSDTEVYRDCRRRTKNFGRPFTIYKLRTMFQQPATTGPSQATPGDQRITTVGRLLRRMRIDELPQLLNVIKGDMSLVGPRPECVEYMETLVEQIPDYPDRLGLRPGLTGIAQIQNGYANDLDSYQRKVAYDVMYLQHCCVVNDLKILLRTIRVVLTGFGAV